ncbi:LuxR family transcriptional regulator [Amycolatopsis mediterranei S699]|uniref:LuxR family transcriptional regulator n=3 Tax=Amycolatopsis mediterranei TaxID=33910 RepID=A0A0H3D6F0_AMYMU|nr:LuxR C-terminal-related transcriptional regulator [Amycolatopsis mediterranei]ADJ45688.1 LuxR family transcriptional regulator [Amycolatopsis mediterranei U32]AEK42468.1 LuxR family transcriptional regulator [Amycolatopsis mediterranei S699]AFO77399.1 LuxR family transcriptional regulator [Amycolatopsis mediterranei S699]AGT84527.1 LuxR family transcriptional regulator [Amycolatopsis mediterranei RB]KDO05734.1 LuxR family transcriptional regulator [Amycolatopsis mediterranei]
MPDRTTLSSRPVPGGKVALPRLPGIFVPRPRLTTVLDRATTRPVTVVRAPAGAGKTTALAGWAGDGHDVAWVSLDEDDNDEPRLWAAILAALRRCPAVPGDRGLDRLGPPSPGRRRAFLADLDDALAAPARPVRLVLDDLQEISRAEPLEALAALARDLPAAMRLVLVTRVEPRLRLARLHVEDVLSRVEAAELRFSARETANLLRATGSAVSDDRVRELTERTGGWAAALGWAAVSVREADDADGLVASVTGDERAVARFFADEVLARLPEATSDLLLCLCVCDAVGPALAVRLSGRGDAGARLDDLERAMGLVTRTPADTYRLPPLLRGFLRAELARQDPQRVLRLHGIAAGWYAGEGRYGEALRHAVAARDRQRVLVLARDHGVRQVLTGDGEPVRIALTHLGAATVAANLPLRLASAVENVQRGLPAEAAADLGAADDGLWPLAARHLALVTGKRPPETGLPAAPPPGFDAWFTLDRAWRSLRRGARRHAVTQGQEALRLAHADRLDHLVLHSRLALAVATAVGGDHAAMRRACTGALAVARRHGWRRSPGVAECHLMLAYDDLMRAEPVAAARELAQAAAAEVPGGAPLLGPLREFFEGMVRFDDGDRTAGSQVMRVARHRLAGLDLPPEIIAVCAVAEYQAALALAEGVHAAEVLAWMHERLPGSGELALLRVRAHLAADEPAAAEAVLRDTGAAAALLPATPVDRCLAETALALRSHRRTKALHALDRALALARPNGLVRPFALAEPQIGHLLIDHSGGFGSLDRFAQAVRSRLVPHAPPSGLTDREQVVLQRLPSQRSLDEIASDLTVSVNTVKTHVRAIYGKLGVNNRRSAVVVARHQGLT